MHGRRLAVKIFLLAMVLAIVSTLSVKATVGCNDYGNCTYCDYWNGDTYAGFIKWCRPAI
jgi:hypothetical protein